MKKIIKKLGILVLIVAMSFSQIAPINAQENYEVPTITVEDGTAKAGETVDIRVVMHNNPGIVSMQLDVVYDASVMSLTKVTDGGIIGSAVHSDNLTLCPYRLTWANDLVTSNYVENGTIVTLTFEINEDTPVGNYSVAVTYTKDNFEIFNCDAEEVDFDTVAGTVKIECPHSNKTEVSENVASCLKGGNNKYYVCDSCGQAFKADGVTKTTVEAEILAKLEHDMSEATCTKPSTCKYGCGYTEGTTAAHTWTEKVLDSAHLKYTASNCSEYNTYWYDCTNCDAVSTTSYFTSTICGAHVFNEKIENTAHLVAGSGEDCQTVKQYYYDCAYCDAIGTEKWSSTTYGEHQMDSEWTTENGKHSHVCTVNGCDYKEDEANCSGGTATCVEKAVCDVCKVAYGELGDHKYKTEWNQGDATGHWHDCTYCSEHSEVTTHTPNVETATEEISKHCTECGYVIEAQLAHTHRTSIVEGYDATCKEEGQKTYYECSCGKWFEDETASVEITDKNSIVIPIVDHVDEDNDGKCDKCEMVLVNEEPGTEEENGSEEGSETEEKPTIPNMGEGLEVLYYFGLIVLGAGGILVGIMYRKKGLKSFSE